MPRSPASAIRRALSRRSVGKLLVERVRGGIVESRHRGSIVEVDVNGAILRTVGDPDSLTTLRSTIKPFALAALVEAGGIEEFELSPAELAAMAGSHSGEDLHVRTLQAVFRRAGLSQGLLACGATGAPLDSLTAARLARDGEQPGPIRHMCSGQHAAYVLFAKLGGHPLGDYWQAEHPVQVAVRAFVGLAFGHVPERLPAAIDTCGVPTYAVTLQDLARAYALLADPAAVPLDDTRGRVRDPLLRIRDAMLAHPEMVAGTRGRLDTALMRALPGRVLSKSGMEGLRLVGILGGPRPAVATRDPSGLAIKIEDGGGYDRAGWAAAVEALRQVGLLDATARTALERYGRPVDLDPHGRVVAETLAHFELAPLGELIV